ncbi:DUF3606 domain-containing protein [Pendulispora brunnea]|uniref:DUF3606 domain-containing protein n=1 Tax=Pendulispora brunnea TaxID=2905690 RepID=UPI00374E1E4E
MGGGYLVKKLGVTADEVRAAVAKVGINRAAVEAELATSSSRSAIHARHTYGRSASMLAQRLLGREAIVLSAF